MSQIKIVLILAFATVFVSCNEELSESTLIGIQPFSKFKEKELNVLIDSIEYTYGCKAVVLPQAKLPKNMMTFIKSPRYRADSILNWLDRNRPDTIDLMLGIIKKDIAITKRDKLTGKVKSPASKYTDWAIFGLGRVNGRSCVVSTHRLHKRANKALFYKRFTRIANHEIGHVLGLHHCPNENCLMNDANETIKTIDNSTGVLCEDCYFNIF